MYELNGFTKGVINSKIMLASSASLQVELSWKMRQ